MKSKAAAVSFIVSAILSICILGCQKGNPGQNRLTARHLAGLCNAIVGYYENNDRFPDNFELLSTDPKGLKWGGEIFRKTPDGSPIRLVPINNKSMNIEVKSSSASPTSGPEWIYSLQVEIVTPTNHNWKIVIVHAPDKRTAVNELRTRGIMENTEWLNPKRKIQWAAESSP